MTADGYTSNPPSGGGGGGSTAWADVTGKPSTFPPSVHTHVATDISNSTTVGRSVLTAADAAAGRTALGAETSGAASAAVAVHVALGDPHTQYALESDLTTALALKAPLASPTFTGTVAGITKAMVGLGSVDNTTDVAKPVSTAAQTALDLKAPLASPALTGNPTAPTQTAGNNSTRVATTAYVEAATSGRPLIYSWTGAAYAVDTDAGVYVGPNDPGAVPNGSIWIDTTP